MTTITIRFTLDESDNVVSIEPGYGWDYFQMQSIVLAMPQMFRVMLKNTKYNKPDSNIVSGLDNGDCENSR